jgi:hypothetical protein
MGRTVMIRFGRPGDIDARVPLRLPPSSPFPSTPIWRLHLRLGRPNDQKVEGGGNDWAHS